MFKVIDTTTGEQVGKLYAHRYTALAKIRKLGDYKRYRIEAAE